MKKSTLLLGILVMLFAACGQGGRRTGNAEESHFVNEVVLKTTPVKDQGRSPLCWAYAMLATIETEHLMVGDSVNLSPDYPARMFLREQAQRYFLTGGAQRVSLRGMSSMLLRLTESYGALAYDAYHNLQGVDYDVLARKAQMTARATISRAPPDPGQPPKYGAGFHRAQI